MEKGLRLQKWGFNIFYLLLLGMAILLPIGTKITNFITAVLLLYWLVTALFERSYKQLFNRGELWFAATLYFLFIIGLFYSQNLNQGFKDIEHKLTLFIFPLIFLTNNKYINFNHKKVLLAFTYSCVATGLYLLLAGLLNYWETQESSVFFYHQYAGAVKMHAVYLSAYFALACIVLLHQILLDCSSTKWLKNLNYAGVVLLTSNLVLLSSKTIVSVFLVISIIFITRHFYKKKKSYIGVILSASVAILLFIAIAFTPNIKQRIDEISESNFAVLHQERFTYDTQFSGLTIRLLFWKYAVEIIDQENAWLLGVGTGDSQDELIQMYKKHNLYLGNSIIKDTGYLHYDTHNQFVETFLKIGLLGVLYLLFYLIKDILLAINKKDILFLSFLVIFIFFSLTESTLQSNKGIVFFAFFNSLFLSSYLNKKTAKNIN